MKANKVENTRILDYLLQNQMHYSFNNEEMQKKCLAAS